MYRTGPGSNSRRLDLQSDSQLLPDRLPTVLRGLVNKWVDRTKTDNNHLRGLYTFMSTSLSFKLLISLKKTSSPYNFKFTRFYCILYDKPTIHDKICRKETLSFLYTLFKSSHALSREFE